MDESLVSALGVEAKTFLLDHDLCHHSNGSSRVNP
jgi:hypothetical protein